MESLRVVALESVRDTLGHLGKYVKIATKESVSARHRRGRRRGDFPESGFRSRNA